MFGFASYFHQNKACDEAVSNIYIYILSARLANIFDIVLLTDYLFFYYGVRKTERVNACN